MVTWSYSAIKTYEQCPHKYKNLYVTKEVKDTGNEATAYGTLMHQAAEDRLKSGTPIPETFKKLVPVVEALDRLPGEKHTELRLGVKKAPTETGFAPCGFFDPDVWMRTVVDVLVINGPKGKLVDYKSSKNARYADTRQLDIMAAATFITYPDVQEIKSGLAFVVCDDWVPKTHKVEKLTTYIGVFNPELEKLEASLEGDVWPKKSGPLCGWCPVKKCEFHRVRR